MRAAAALLLVALGPAAAAQEEVLRLPSGLEARFFEMVSDQPAGGGLVYRFRYVAAAFTGGDERFDAVSEDLAWLCETHAVPRISTLGPQPGRVVISLGDRESPFGVYDPAVTQVFEAYRPVDGACIWEMF